MVLYSLYYGATIKLYKKTGLPCSVTVGLRTKPDTSAFTKEGLPSSPDGKKR